MRENGSLWCWGLNDRGQLGQGESGDPIAAPVQVGSDVDWARVEAGSRHTCAAREDGSLWCWGANHDGQIGQGESGDDVLDPVEVACPAP